MVCVHAQLGWKVKRNGKTGLALVQQVFVPAVGLLDRCKPRVLTHGPETTAIHRGLVSSRVRVFSGEPNVAHVVHVDNVLRCIEELDVDAGTSRAVRIGLACLAGWDLVSTLLPLQPCSFQSPHMFFVKHSLTSLFTFPLKAHVVFISYARLRESIAGNEDLTTCAPTCHSRAPSVIPPSISFQCERRFSAQAGIQFSSSYHVDALASS